MTLCAALLAAKSVEVACPVDLAILRSLDEPPLLQLRALRQLKRFAGFDHSTQNALRIITSRLCSAKGWGKRLLAE